MPRIEETSSLTADERIADKRIITKGIPFLDATYPQWRSDAWYSPILMSSPTQCLLCWLERYDRRFGKKGERNRNDLAIVTGAPIIFQDVLKKHSMSIDEAVACGFARGTNDPVTFYAALRDRWHMQFRKDRMLV